jgi:acetyl esterase/lipase
VKPDRIPYGSLPDQFADVRHPAGNPLATLVLLHGGGFREDHHYDLMNPMADALTQLGYLTVNLEYRRVGGSGGYPVTFDDVATAMDSIAGTTYDDKVVVLGHSSGGQLSAWAGSRTAKTPGGAPRTRLHAAISLSGALDLAADAELPNAGQDIVSLMGGTAAQVPQRYAVVDPMELVPTCPIWAAQAADDEIIPQGQAEKYVDHVRAAGATATYVSLPGHHNSLIDPGAPCFAGIRKILEQAFR